MNLQPLPYIVGIVVGAIIGVFVARRSIAEKPVRGGTPVRAFHYLASAAFSSTFPASLTATFMRLPLLSVLATGLSLALASLILLLVYAVFEAPAQTGSADDAVWTAQKARESRL